MNKNFSLDVSNIDIEEINNRDFMKLKIYAISDQVNRNNSEFLRESFETSIPTIYNKPILAYYNTSLDDTEEHNGRLDIDDEGVFTDYQYTEGERAVGVIPESAEIYIENIDGKNWVVIDGCVIWTEYNRQLYKLIKRQLKKKVSVEIEMLDWEEVDGVTKIKAWKFNGITVLGKHPEDGSIVEEGIEGAHLQTLDYSNSLKFNRYLSKLSFALNEDKSLLSKYGIEGKKDFNQALTVNELSRKIGKLLDEETFTSGDECYYRFYINDIILNDNIVIVNDSKEDKMYAIKFEINGDEVTIDFENKKEADLVYIYKKIQPTKRLVMINKEDYGTEPAIEIDKSKDSVSNKSWGDVNKASLREKVLKAKNYKTLVKSVYLKVEEGWEDAPSEHIKYPVMEIINGKAVYNAGGLLSAQQYGESNDKDIANKAENIRKKLGLIKSKKEENMKEFIKAAKETGFICLGLHNGKLLFAKEAEFEDEDKEIEETRIYEIEKEACEDSVIFDENLLSKVCMDEDDDEDKKDDIEDEDPEDDNKDDDNKDDDDKDDEENKKLEEAKKEVENKLMEAEEANKKMAEELEETKKELEAMKEEKFIEETDKIMEAEEDLKEDYKAKLEEMRNEKKFSTVEDFVRELAYIKFVNREKKEGKARLDFSLEKKDDVIVTNREITLSEKLNRI